MKTNLIQAYANKSPLQQYQSEKAKSDFDVKKELTNRTFIKPLPSNGELVRNTIFDMPAQYFKDVKYDFKALKHSLSGSANDHELGCLNDLGMKLGGLGIATYLFSRKGTPLTKVMEFVGLTSFFAAMDIWPKLALQIPAYLVHGFNIRQEYKDNYGTKKPVFLDHQFIPWDLYSDKEIYQIGDRMGVPKDIKNRRDFIQEKMRKVALQNNTMWMLTSGFATPIMSALICNALEKPINKYQDAKLNGEAQDLMENFTSEYSKLDFSKNIKKLNGILEANKDKSITPKLFSEILETLSEGLDSETTKALKKDLQDNFIKQGYDFNDDTLEAIRNACKKEFSSLNLSETDLNKIIPSRQQLSDSMQELLKNNEYVTDFTGHIKNVVTILEKNISEFEKAGASREIIEDLEFMTGSMLQSKNIRNNSALVEAFKAVKSAKLTQNIIDNIQNVAGVLRSFKARTVILNKYAYIKAAQAPETILANSWNDLSEGLIKTFGITNEEITKARYDREFVGRLLRDKLEMIVADENLYDSVVDDLQKKLSSLERKTAFGIFDKENKNSENLYLKRVNTTFDEADSSLKGLGMQNTARKIAGYYDGDTRSLKDIQLSFITDRVKGVRCSFYRILNTLDMYRRISKMENINAISNDMPRVMKEEIVEMCKELLIKGHCADYSVKFNHPVDMDLNPEFGSDAEREEFKSQIEVKKGKVVNKFKGKKAAEELADNAYDKKFYEAAMKLMYSETPHPDTLKKITETPFFDDFMKYRQEIFNAFGNEKYFAKPYHVIANTYSNATNELKFLLLGCAPDEMFTKICSQKYNGNKWLKIFAGSGAALLGITTLSQFFMGKMNSDKIKEKN